MTTYVYAERPRRLFVRFAINFCQSEILSARLNRDKKAKLQLASDLLRLFITFFTVRLV